MTSGGRSARHAIVDLFPWGSRTYIMGVINATPDSFSGDGVLTETTDRPEALAVAQAHAMQADGADVLDIGGVATFPGAPAVDSTTEAARVLPLVRCIRDSDEGKLSIDSTTASVVSAALEVGVDLVNTCWGLRQPDGQWDVDLARVIGASDTPVVLAHNRRGAVGSTSGIAHYIDVEYEDVVNEVLVGLRSSIDVAMSHGVSESQIIVDPGIGQGKTPQQNIVLLRELDAFRSLGRPLLVAASRKSFLGLITGGRLPEDRGAATLATTAIAIAKGVDIVRVHDVRQNRDAALVADALVRQQVSR